MSFIALIIKIFNHSYDNIQSYIENAHHVKSQEFIAEIAIEKALDKFMRRALEWRFKS